MTTAQAWAFVVGIVLVVAGVGLLGYSILRQKADSHATVTIFGIHVTGERSSVITIVGAVVIIIDLIWSMASPGSSGPLQASPSSTSEPSTSSSPSSSTSVPAPPSTPEPPAAEPVRITAPSSGQKVIGKNGVRLEGTAGSAYDRHLWIFDHADNGMYYQISSFSLVVDGGRWAFNDPQVGSASREDDGHTFVLVVVSADETCAAGLEKPKPNADGDIVYSKLPAGCKEEAKVSVVKTSS